MNYELKKLNLFCFRDRGNALLDMCDFNFVGAQYMENQDWKTKEEALLLTVGLVHKKCHRLQ